MLNREAYYGNYQINPAMERRGRFIAPTADLTAKWNVGARFIAPTRIILLNRIIASKGRRTPHGYCSPHEQNADLGPCIFHCISHCYLSSRASRSRTRPVAHAFPTWAWPVRNVRTLSLRQYVRATTLWHNGVRCNQVRKNLVVCPITIDCSS